MWKRVIAPTVVLSLLWVILGGATIYYIGWLYDSQSRVLSENVTTIQAAGAMQDALWRLHATVLEVAGHPSPPVRAEVAKLEKAFAQHLAEAESTAMTPEERLLVQSIRERSLLYRQQLHRRLDAGDPGRQAMEEATRLARSMDEPCKQLLDVNQRLIRESTAERKRLGDWFEFVMVALLIAGPAIGIVCGFWVARGLHRSISQLSVTLKDAACGMEHEVGRVDISPSGDLPTLQQQVEVVSVHIKQVIEQLQQARREAMRAERLAAVGELAAGVAHELRNPLTAVKLLIQARAQRPANQPLTEKQLHVLQEEIARMENTIQGLLDFARPPQLQRVRHDLLVTLRRAINLVEGRVKQQQAVLLETTPQRPVWIEGDPEQLHQVFVNLLLNAIEATPQGGELRIAVQSQDAPAHVCRITFSDSGPGIPQAVLTRLFEPFVTSKERGTGLGLAVSRRIVQEHRGLLAGANRAEGGAVFTVELPLPEEPAAIATRRPDPVATNGSPFPEADTQTR